MRPRRATVLVGAPLLWGACGTATAPESWRDWYDQGSPYDVEEPIAFTDQNYDFTGPDEIQDLPIPGDFETWFAEGDAPPPDACDAWSVHPGLPAEISGIVTIHPRYYIKVSGCLPADDRTIDSDEKYYGSYFIQDATGGFFVLGDSKVAHFDMGDRVTIKVRGIKESFDSVMISAHDVLEIDRGPEPIYYRPVSGRLLGPEDIAEVVRVEGVVAAEASGFGEVYLCTGADPDTTLEPDPARGGDPVPACAHLGVTDPPWFKLGIDVELQRRGVTFDPGSHLSVTGPVILSFGDHQIVVMRIGQIEVL
ncbi:MAG TPA: hypothetical protein ENK18_12480 [Deltaproteobacteria bacterium]|nr:hypothetical protein [Deltaproteobacteria bacterium]